MISDASGKLRRWREHFEQVMAVTREVDTNTLATIPPLPMTEGESGSVVGLEDLVTEPDEEEVSLAIS